MSPRGIAVLGALLVAAGGLLVIFGRTGGRWGGLSALVIGLVLLWEGFKRGRSTGQ